jgi:cell division protein FtsI (penicillin-binding protein 3)
MSRGLPFAANPLLAVRLPAFRSRLVMLMVALAFISLVARAVYLQVISNEFLQRQGEVRYGRTVELPASRGKVLDRNGAVLASSLPARAIWASPEDFQATPEQIAQLAGLLQIREQDLQRLVGQDGRTFV